MDRQFEKEISELGSQKEQTEYMMQALNYCAEYIRKAGETDPGTEKTEKENAELRLQNQELTSRLEKAKEFFQENKKIQESAEERIRATIARNLQKTRDELYVTGNALHALAVSLAEKPAFRMTLIEANNLQGCIAEAIENLRENGLWDEEKDLKPDLAVVEKAAKPKTPRKPRKKPESEEAPQTAEHTEQNITEE